jgi:hypothetical protein
MFEGLLVETLLCVCVVWVESASRLKSQRSLESSIFPQNIRDFNDALLLHALAQNVAMCD